MTYGRTPPDMARQYEAIARVAPKLPPERVTHWARVIAGDVGAGRYSAKREWEIAGEIAAENRDAGE